MWWYLFSLGWLKNNKMSFESSWSSILAYDYWEISIVDKTSS